MIFFANDLQFKKQNPTNFPVEQISLVSEQIPQIMSEQRMACLHYRYSQNSMIGNAKNNKNCKSKFSQIDARTCSQVLTMIILRREQVPKFQQ